MASATNEDNDRNSSPIHRRNYFRVLRVDENLKELRPKKIPSKSDVFDDNMVIQHIRHGSRPDFKSPLISLTAELNVALAFAGIVSRIAVIDLQSEKKPSEVKHLDKEYLRKFLTDTDAIARSRRSDEVVVFGTIKSGKVLPIKIKECRRKVAPGFANEDSNVFPSTIKSLQTIKSLSGSNKRLFQVVVDGIQYVACLPRPNYSLHDPVLFDDELVRLCNHQFDVFCAYRTLSKHVPRCALYSFKLEASFEDFDDSGVFDFNWALILMENLELDNLPEDKVLDTAKDLFSVDAILGNWECVEGKDIEELSSASNACYAQTESGNIVRLAVDRALGCVYPEDENKADKAIVKFEPGNMEYLKANLQQNHQWCFGGIEERHVVQRAMSMQLDSDKTMNSLEKVLKGTEWPPWMQHEEGYTIWNILKTRISDLMSLLPFYKIEPKFSSLGPAPRDGHGAVSHGCFMYIAGGNSKTGALKDLWRFDVNGREWQRFQDMPKARYSFSMHLWQNCIIVFGGCLGKSRSDEMFQDLLVYDIAKDEWEIKERRQEVWPPGRCRQGSNLVTHEDGSAEMYVLGGWGGTGGKKKDAWKLKLFPTNGKFDWQWIQLPDMAKETHRCFSFGLEGKIFVIGGFGHSLMNLQVINGSEETIVTHDLMKLPPSEKRAFKDSKSLSGFDAVFDDIEQRLILVGGGNLGRQSGGMQNNRSFGNIDAHVQSRPRILSLNHNKDTKYNTEWKWKTYDLYESLDTKLPNLLSWSTCLIDHSVILFGGRQGDYFSNEVIKVQLRPEYVTSLKEIGIHASLLNQRVEQALLRWPQEKAKEGTVNAANAKLTSLDNSPAVHDKKKMDLSAIRILDLNVHGWCNDNRTSIIDEEINDMIKLYTPNVVCFQEVKHPFPANKGNHVVRVNNNDKSALLRYSDDESPVEIMKRFVNSNVSQEVKTFLNQKEKRNSVKYLEKVFKNTSDIIELNDNVLERISKSMKTNFLFCPALDHTFGNAIISKCSGSFRQHDVCMRDAEKRNACMVAIDHSRNWDFSIINVHLDERKEETRVNQVRDIIDWLKTDEILLSLPHVLCGDLNALSYWSQETTTNRASNGFEAPTNKLYNLLTEDLKYVDLEDKQPPSETSKHGTRVDYVLCSEGLYPRLSSHKMHVLPTKSDHSALFSLLNFDTNKAVIGITGMLSSGLHKAAFELQKNLGGQRVKVIRDLADQIDLNSSAMERCFSDICKSLYDNDTVIVTGQHLQLLLPCMDLVFLLEFVDSEKFKVFEKLNRKPYGFTKSMKEYYQAVLRSWDTQKCYYNEPKQRAGGFNKIHNLQMCKPVKTAKTMMSIFQDYKSSD